MRKPPAGDVVLVQFGAGGGDGGDDALLPGGEIKRPPRRAATPTAAEQADPVEAQRDRLASVELG